MKISEAIARADALRDNLLEESQKADWLWKLDGKLAQMMALDAPPETAQTDGAGEEPSDSPAWPAVNIWPETDAALLMPAPHDDIYALYLVAMIDYYNQESILYQNDMTVYNAALNEALAWWRRTHRPKQNGPVLAW